MVLGKREEAQITEHHQHEVFFFVWQVYDWCFHRSFRHTLRTLIKRVISICAGLKVHFNQVNPLEVWIGQGGEGKEINWAVDQGQTWKKTNTGEKKSFTLVQRVIAKANFIRFLHWISFSCVHWLNTTFIYQCVNSRINYSGTMWFATSLQVSILLRILHFATILSKYIISKN